jgi:hypothetical protein
MQLRTHITDFRKKDIQNCHFYGKYCNFYPFFQTLASPLTTPCVPQVWNPWSRLLPLLHLRTGRRDRTKRLDQTKCLERTKRRRLNPSRHLHPYHPEPVTRLNNIKWKEQCWSPIMQCFPKSCPRTIFYLRDFVFWFSRKKNLKVLSEIVEM